MLLWGCMDFLTKQKAHIDLEKRKLSFGGTNRVVPLHEPSQSHVHTLEIMSLSMQSGNQGMACSQGPASRDTMKLEASREACDGRRAQATVAREVVRPGTERVPAQLRNTHLKPENDHKVNGRPCQAGQLVWLHSPAVPQGRSRRHHRPWAGPFRVTHCLGGATYRIENTARQRHHMVVHSDRLKPCPPDVCLSTPQQRRRWSRLKENTGREYGTYSFSERSSETVCNSLRWRNP